MIIYSKNGEVLLNVEVDDTSVRYKAIKGENTLTLKFSLEEHVEVPIGSYCEFKGEVYYLMAPEDFTMKNRRNFEYSLVMYTDEARAKRCKFINPVDGRLKFSLTAKPREHLQMFVDNMNMRDSGWEVGECPDLVEVALSYNHTFCYDAVVQLANELELDFWYEGRTVNLGKLERHKENPLPLSYGGDGEGLKPDIKRTNYSDALPVEVLYVQGSDKNIDPSKYRVTEDKKIGSSELLLPVSQTIGFDGTYFEDEDGFDSSKARYYKTDDKGYSIRRADKEIAYNSEDSIECSEIYPTKEETVFSVIEVNAEKHFYDIMFKSTVDYSKYLIDGENATIIFQSGMLAGKEFDLATDDYGNLVCREVAGYWLVEIVPQVIDGITMPDVDSGYIPVKDNTFKVFNIQLPQEYIADNDTKSGAEWDMFRFAVKHMYSNEDAQYTITGTLDEIYAKRNWVNIEGRLQLGNYISFTDKSFQAEPLLIRITGIKEYVNKPHSPVLEISNASIGGSLIGTLNRIENEEVVNEERYEQSRQFTKRRFRSAQETIEMLKAALDNYSEGIRPITVQTMSMLVGDESLQFAFTANRDSLVPINPCPLFYDTATKTMKCDVCSLVHMTLDITDVTPARKASDYKSWDVLSWESAYLEDASASYYVYAKAPMGDTIIREFVLSERSLSMRGDDGYYYFLVGILNAEYDGSRDFVTLYGFTEVLPGQITTDVIRSADGKTYFDLANGKIAGDITFTSSDGTSKGMADFASEVQDQIDGVVENWSAEGHPYIDSYPVSEWATDAEKIAHINDTYVNIEAYVDDESTPTAGQAWRWCQCAEGITPYFEIESEVTSTDWEKIGKIDPKAPYAVVQTRRNGTVLSSVGMAFDTDIKVQSGPPVYIKVEKATGDVYIKDASRYFESYPVSLRFIYSGFVSVTDKDGNRINLHWHPIADSDAVRALKDATTANRLLDSVDSDNVLTGIEKHSIRESIKKITSVRYPAELLDQEYNAVGTGSFAERYNELYRKGYDSAADSIYDTLVEILLLLNNNGVWDEGNSEVEPNFRSQLETLLSDYCAYEAYGTNRLSSDFDYLKETFKKGSTTVNGGLVMTDMVAVRDSDEEVVEAFLNGSGFASDTEHGKLLIAAGIEQGEADIEERSKEAKTRVYEDGHIESNDIKLKEGCVIGDAIKIYDRGILMQDEGTSALKINPVQGLTVTNTAGVSGQIGHQPAGQWLVIGSPNATDLLYYIGQPIGIHIIMASTEEAIRCDSGVFAGLRPSFKKISTLGQHQISARDHTIVIGATSTGTVTLLFPDTPSHGQRYEILVASQNTTLVVTTHGVNGFDINSGAEVSSGRIYFTASSSYKRKFVFTYDASSNLWFYYYNNLTA